MSERKKSVSDVLFKAVRAGILTVLIDLAALIPASVFFRLGWLPGEKERWIVAVFTFLSAAAAAKICRLGREGGIPETIPAALLVLLILSVMGIAIPGNRFRFLRILPCLAAAEAGYLTGAIMQINKKYRKPRRKRR